jgi:hypothetical protein
MGGSMKEMKKCCICNKSFDGFGNNPDPVKKRGYCCDNCNLMVVIPERIKQFQEMKK